MEVRAKAKFLRNAPRKTRLVIAAVRGLSVDKAIDQLNNMNKKVALPVRKLVESAIANALNNFDLKRDSLFIKEISADEGPVFRRWMPRARGRATPIRKKTSHINIVLGERVDSGVVESKKQKVEAPIKLGEKPKEDEGILVKGKKAEKEIEKPEAVDEMGKKIVDPRGEGHGTHTKIEGKNTRGFANKIFRRKSG